MDIIDVVLGGGFSPKGRISTYAALAQKAVADANTAINNIDTITEQTNANNEAAAEALDNANAALAAVNEALENIEEASSGVDITAVDNEIDKLALSLTTSMTNEAISKNLVTAYPAGDTSTIKNLLIMYQQSGNNINGTMTQKAITNYVNSVKQELQTAINNITISGGGGSTNLGIDNAGTIVVVGPDGNITAGNATEADVIEALIKAGAYSLSGVVGMELDYENKVYTRTQDGKILQPGADYNKYAMFGGRKRCNVADNGTITAWYGDANYADDGSNGQVMVYQPKFYYQRVVINSQNSPVLGKIVKKESLILSDTPITGFKIHPLFINADGEEVDYVLLPAYDGSIYDTSESTYLTTDKNGVAFEADKLSSVGSVKPASGQNNMFTITNAEQLAQNRGEGWHITNMRADSANQMLFMTEYGSPNGQLSLELGVCEINSTNTNCSSITGSTASLGNASGAAAETVNEINGVYTTYSEAGKRAISYRGVENPWGNIWHMVGGALLVGNRSSQGGIPYVCTDYNYSVSLTDNYESIGFMLPVSESFISAFGYGNPKYDWVYMPIECSDTANNILPIGDCLWTINNLNGTHMILNGGHYAFKEKDGLFCYAGDANPTQYDRAYGAKLMFIPKKNAVYNNNIAAWTAKMGG